MLLHLSAVEVSDLIGPEGGDLLYQNFIPFYGHFLNLDFYTDSF